MKLVVRLDPAAIPPLYEVFNPGRQVRGTPDAAVDEREGSGKTVISLGMWTATEGAVRVSYEEDEMCVIASGRVRLTDEGGDSEEFGPGEGFLIQNGFQGVWDTLEAVRKWYVIYK